MKQSRTAYGLFIASWLVFAVGCTGRAPEGGYWRYSLSGSSPFFNELHRYDDDPTHDKRLILALTVFSGRDHAVHYLLENSGVVVTERDGTKSARRGTTETVALVRSQLTQLTPGGEYPPPERMVLLRWLRDGQWTTARFDRADLPMRLQDVAVSVTGQVIGDIAP